MTTFEIVALAVIAFPAFLFLVGCVVTIVAIIISVFGRYL